MTKVTIVGAGSVGTASAFALLHAGRVDEICLYDIDVDKVRAEVADLSHAAAVGSGVTFSGGHRPDVTAGSDVLVITAGTNRAPGQTRLELAEKNTSLVVNIAKDLMAQSPEAVIVVVTNPCDVVATIAQGALALPPSRVISSGTLLDTARLRSVLAGRMGVSPGSVSAWVLGEHGESQFVLWSEASIAGVPLGAWQGPGGALSAADQEEIARSVRDAGKEVIEGKGVTNWGIGQSVARIVRAVVTDEHHVLPVATVLNGYQGISGVAVSVPHLVNRHGAHPVAMWQMDSAERDHLVASAREVEQSVSGVGVPPTADRQ
jgi:L-lactate dehydrogenase